MELLIIFLSILAAATICLLAKSRGVIECVSVVASFIALVGSVLIALKVSKFGVYAPYEFFSVNALGAIVACIIGLVGFGAVTYSVGYLREETAKEIIGFTRVKQFFVLLNLFLATMLLAVTASNPIFTWIAIEATTLSTAFLISFYNKPSAMEAAWKYLIVNSVGLLLGFFGTLLYFTSLRGTGEVGFMTWDNLLSGAAHLDPMIAKIAFIFVLIGYGTKAGLAPMHTWLPDAHSKAPAPISALLSGVLLNVALVTVLRFKGITDISVGPEFAQKLFIVFGLLSLFVATLIIFTQKSYKRLLAYSSIENMGIMTIGFGFGGLGVFAAILHMIYHSLLKSVLFFSAGNTFLRYSSTKIATVRGVINALPVTGVIFLVATLAITGTPPFGIFLTKMFILSAGMKTYPIVAVVAIFLMALLFVGFFKHITTIIFGEKPDEVAVGEKNMWLVMPPLALIIIALCLSFYIPPFLNNLIIMASHS